jgi:IS5 family transposase
MQNSSIAIGNKLHILRIRLGRIIRDIRRKIGSNEQLEAAFVWLLSRADQIRSQQQRQRGWKLYSFHAPDVECIGKGKAIAPLRVWCQGLDRHRQWPSTRWAIRASAMRYRIFREFE